MEFEICIIGHCFNRQKLEGIALKANSYLISLLEIAPIQCSREFTTYLKGIHKVWKATRRTEISFKVLLVCV
jgi:hypothetical protein